MKGQMHKDVLELLPFFFHLERASLQRVMEALAELVNDTFPASSHDLQKHSTQDRDYRRLLLQIMSGGVRAAEDTRDVSPLLEVWFCHASIPPALYQTVVAMAN